MKIIVLAGGDSPERDVSIRSGKAVARALCSLCHEVALLDPIREVPKGNIFTSDGIKVINDFDNYIKTQRKIVCPLHPSILNACLLCEKVFPALHGGIGENGRLQALFECFGISYAGSSAEACSAAMDKIITKRLYESAAIRTPLYTVHKYGSKKPPLAPRYPCVIKPANGGSSIGVCYASSPSELEMSVEKAHRICDSVIIEEKIVGRELSVSVLNDTPLAVTEIIPQSQYYDYESKYAVGGARELTPAPVPGDITKRALTLALNAHKALGMKNFSRTDMILQSGSSLLYLLETNTLPGLTETSILPQAAQANGIDFPSLCLKMLY